MRWVISDVIDKGIARCLSLLRRHGIIHCDLKPENVLLTLPQPYTSPNNINVKVSQKSTKYLIVYLFCLTPISSETPRRSTVKFGTHTRTDHNMQDLYMLGFMSVGVVVTKIMTFFNKKPSCR